MTDSTFGAQSVCGTPEYMAPEVMNGFCPARAFHVHRLAFSFTCVNSNIGGGKRAALKSEIYG